MVNQYHYHHHHHHYKRLKVIYNIGNRLNRQDHQALLTSGPRQTNKPQVYQEVDIFLRNIDNRDEFFGVADEVVSGSVQTPSNEGDNTPIHNLELFNYYHHSINNTHQIQ
ncbi:hypothetical protein ACTFIZ_003806 [Dictyostelium cf. discoideum]